MSWEEEFPDDEVLMDKLSQHSTGPLVSEDEMADDGDGDAKMEESEFAEEEEIVEEELVEEEIEEVEIVESSENQPDDEKDDFPVVAGSSVSNDTTPDDINDSAIGDEAESSNANKSEDMGDSALVEEGETAKDVESNTIRPEKDGNDGGAENIETDAAKAQIADEPATTTESSPASENEKIETPPIDNPSEKQEEEKDTSENAREQASVAGETSEPTEAASTTKNDSTTTANARNNEKVESSKTESPAKPGRLSGDWEKKVSQGSKQETGNSSSPGKLGGLNLATTSSSSLVSSADLVKEQSERLGGEMQHLLQDIRRVGQAGKPEVTFGELFDDPQVEQYYEALVGTLKGAKKRGLITFKGQMLLKGPHDNVVISIVQKK